MSTRGNETRAIRRLTHVLEVLDEVLTDVAHDQVSHAALEEAVKLIDEAVRWLEERGE